MIWINSKLSSIFAQNSYRRAICSLVSHFRLRRRFFQHLVKFCWVWLIQYQSHFCSESDERLYINHHDAKIYPGSSGAEESVFRLLFCVDVSKDHFLNHERDAFHSQNFKKVKKTETLLNRAINSRQAREQESGWQKQSGDMARYTVAATSFWGCWKGFIVRYIFPIIHAYQSCSQLMELLSGLLLLTEKTANLHSWYRYYWTTVTSYSFSCLKRRWRV